MKKKRAEQKCTSLLLLPMLLFDGFVDDDFRKRMGTIGSYPIPHICVCYLQNTRVYEFNGYTSIFQNRHDETIE